MGKRHRNKQRSKDERKMPNESKEAFKERTKK